MDDTEHHAAGEPPSGGRMPSGALAAALHERVAAILRVLDSAAFEARGSGGAASLRLLEKYRASLHGAMAALGELLADFFEESAEPVDLPRLRSEFLEPLLAVARTLPIFRRSVSWVTDQQDAAELQELVIDGHPAGFDVQSVLLSDYLQQVEGSAAMRARVTGVMRLMREELSARGAFEGRPLSVLVLGANGVSGLETSLARRQVPEMVRRASLSVLIVDPASHTLRRVRQTIDVAFGTHSKVLLCSPAELSRHPSRPRHPFDIVYTLSAYDVLSRDDAFAFTRSIAPFVKPGGALLTCSYLPVFARSTQALAFALVGLQFQFWDEAKWKDILAALPFDVEASRFEVYPPAALALLARRNGEEAAG